ncbi:ornithine cyclodeaminase family protein [Corynebacterium glaucum]|uniref:ornithine cyclodeaminase family protein n=1 Tax=Corynebacterium glaucum TaxID=187491 RepID=UPI00265A9EDF|nr:ornithine cyclodeaminase family protein [Corynebacterium glaucum]
MRYLGSEALLNSLRPREAVEAIRRPLLEGFDPATDPHRIKVGLDHGEMHVLPSSDGKYTGVKILGIQPPGSTEQVPLVQGSYLLMGGRTLTPELLLDAASLTQLRTPAVAVAGVLDLLRASSEPLEVAIYGTGVQGRAHAETLIDALHGIREVHCTFISRTQPADLPWPSVAAGSAEFEEIVSRAGLVITATSSPEPIVTSEQLLDDAIVLAVGAHTADTRELHEDVLRGAQVIVEDIAAAKREAGDVVQAIQAGAIAPTELIPMRDVVRGEVALDPGRRVVFKTVGMPWEDLAVARAVAVKATNHG